MGSKLENTAFPSAFSRSTQVRLASEQWKEAFGDAVSTGVGEPAFADKRIN